LCLGRYQSTEPTHDCSRFLRGRGDRGHLNLTSGVAAVVRLAGLQTWRIGVATGSVTHATDPYLARRVNEEPQMALTLSTGLDLS